MVEQAGFLFDAPLTIDPQPQIKPAAPREDEAQFIAKLKAVLPELPDEIGVDAPLLAIGLAEESLTGWHRARSIEALSGCGERPEFQAYRANGKLRYRRLLPLEPCPGYEGDECSVLTRGGVRCVHHLAVEEEDLWNN